MLRAIETQEISRVGYSRQIPLNMRVIATTTRPLEPALSLGGFRPDLYHRLNALHIALPPLRDRPEDIPALADEMLVETTRHLGRSRPSHFTPEAIALLKSQIWKGNVRELGLVIYRVVAYLEQDVITEEDVIAAVSPGLLRTGDPSGPRLPLRQRVETFERECIRQALAEADGNARHAADLCGMAASTFHRRGK